MKKVLIACAMLALAACGGGTSGGGGGGSTLAGPTPFFGLWQVVATITAIVGGTTNNIDHTSILNVHQNGVVSIQSTDSDCALTVLANGATLIYQERCTFPTETAPCVLTFTTNAGFSGDNVSGSFGPDSFVCVGSATSYAGNLVGARFDPDAEDNNGDSSNGTDGNGTEEDPGTTP